MQRLVKIYKEEGHLIPQTDQVWCAVITTDCVRTVCGGALDCDTDFEWIERYVQRGGITCPVCLNYIKQHKVIKL